LDVVPALDLVFPVALPFAPHGVTELDEVVVESQEPLAIEHQDDWTALLVRVVVPIGEYRIAGEVLSYRPLRRQSDLLVTDRRLAQATVSEDAFQPRGGGPVVEDPSGLLTNMPIQLHCSIPHWYAASEDATAPARSGAVH